MTHQIGAATTAFEHALELHSDERPNPLTQAYLGYSYARNGQRKKAISQIKQLNEYNLYSGAVSFARGIVYLGLADFDSALTQLNQAVDERFDRMLFLTVDPIFDSIRQQPGYEELLARTTHKNTASLPID